MHFKTLLQTVTFALLCFITKAQVSVTTQHNDLLRTGWNNRETALTPANVNNQHFGNVFRVSVDDQIYAQPLVASDVLINGSKQNVVYVATVGNTVYAIDGANGTVYWSKNYTPASQRPPKNTDMTGACGGNYRDFSGNIGIVGTPVIDSATQTIYFVARSIDGNNQFYQYLHAVDIKTGNENSGSPMLIEASVSNASGAGSKNGVVSFDPQKNNQRQALTLFNGTVYITFSSHCDWGPYHGWVLGYDKTTLQRKAVYNVTPDGYNAGLWESGGGPAVDANSSNMYLVTGNGNIGTLNGLSDLRGRGESALQIKLTDNAITPTDFFTPYNYDALEAADLDYGSMAAFLIPNTNLFLTGCKDGNMYLLDTADLGGLNSSYNRVKQTIALGSNITLRCQPSYYRSTGKEFVYVWSENSQLKAYPVDRSANNLNVNSLITGTPRGPEGAIGAMLSTSSNGDKDGTGIVWASYASNGDANQSVRPGILRAFDANDITKELWNSDQNATRDAVGNYAKFSSPTIANGKVYLSTFSNQLIAYGITDTVTQTNCGDNLSLNKPAYASSTEGGEYLPGNATDASTDTRWASAKEVDPQWIYVDLGHYDSICNISLTWEVALAEDFKIQVSVDTSNWTTIDSVSGNTSFSNSFNVKAAGRYVRILGTKRGTPYGYSLYDFKVFGSEIEGCVTPTGVTVNNIDTTSAVIRWNAVNGALSYNVQYKLTAASTWQQGNTQADTLQLADLSCSNYYDYRVQTVCTDGSTSNYSAQGSFNTLTCGNCGFLPTRIYTGDIGDVGIGGEACFSAPDNYVVKGSGKDVADTADAFRFVYKTFTGDGQVEVKVETQDATARLNKAGVMFRQTLDANSPNVFMNLSSARGAIFQYRKKTGGRSAGENVEGLNAPYYVRIVKKGTQYKGFVSADYNTWTMVSSINIPTMGLNGSAIYAGLAVTSHNNTKLSTANFKQFDVVFDSGEQTTDKEANLVKGNTLKNVTSGQMKLNVYPNPARSNFTVDFSIAQKQNITVSITGLGDGRIYYKESLTNFSGSYHKDNASFRLKSGSYVVFVKTNTGVVSKILIKE